MRHGSSRRDFLNGLGAAGAGVVGGAAGVAAPAGRAAGPPAAPARRYASGGAPARSVDFGRIFPGLPPSAEASDRARAGLLEVSKPGGIMDAGDHLSAGPKALIVDPAVNGNPTASDRYGSNPDNPTMSAGSTFVGQFIDHDITFGQTSQLGVPQNPLISPNTRTPALDLDSVFGGGPRIRPDLYVADPDGSVRPKLKLDSGGVPETCPGTPTATRPTPRCWALRANDETVIIAGLQCPHILFYNWLLDELAEHDLRGFPAGRRGELANRYVQFLIARGVTLWHYHWLLVNEHPPQIAGQQVVNDVLVNGNRFYTPTAGYAFMPIEFGAAAYRFGHSMVRPSYRANFTSGTGDSPSPTANPVLRARVRPPRLHARALPLLRPGRDARRVPLSAPGSDETVRTRVRRAGEIGAVALGVVVTVARPAARSRSRPCPMTPGRAAPTNQLSTPTISSTGGRHEIEMDPGTCCVRPG